MSSHRNMLERAHERKHGRMPERGAFPALDADDSGDHDDDQHGWGGCGVEGCDCVAGWEY